MSRSFAAAKAETARRWAEYKPAYSPLAKIGRPTKYNPAYCDDIVERMSQGFSLSAYCDYAQINRSTINEWVEKHPAFSQAVERGKNARLHFWEQLGLEVAKTGGEGSQATMIIFGLKNMGSDEWKEKIEHSGTITLASLVESSMRSIETRNAELPAGNSETIDAQAIDITDETPTSFFD